MNNPHYDVSIALVWPCSSESSLNCLIKNYKYTCRILKYITDETTVSSVFELFELRKNLMISCCEHVTEQLACLNVCVVCLHCSKKFCVRYGKLSDSKPFIALCGKCFRKTWYRQLKYLPIEV